MHAPKQHRLMQPVAPEQKALEAHLPPGQVQLNQGPPGASCTSRRPPTRPRLLQMMPSAERGTRSRHTTSCRADHLAGTGTKGACRHQRTTAVSRQAWAVLCVGLPVFSSA